MKKILVLLALVFASEYKSQTYSSQNISLVSIIAPNTSNVPGPVGNLYSGCWGWYQQAKNKEYGISGASNGTYFIDITNPATPSVSAFLQGKLGCTWREIKTYKNYCYIASDDSKPNTFQIVDMQYLPDSVHIVHNSNTLLEKGHTLWVDSNLLYVGAATFSAGFSPMAIYSLATPSAPLLLKKLDEDIGNSVINYVHDMYVRHDTVFASAGTQGLHILKYTQAQNTLTILGSYTGYHQAGYNHSSFLTQNGKYLLFCDETQSAPIHMVDVQNLSNIQPLQSFYSTPLTVSHNPYLIGNNFAIVTCYQDGLFIYDISQPGNIKQVGYFDTYPQGGVNTGSYTANLYSGNWGAYPYLPSGLIVANDMQNGMFVLNPAAAYTTTVKQNVNALGLETETNLSARLILFPNPASKKVTINAINTGEATMQITNTLGQIVFDKVYNNFINDEIDLHRFNKGLYSVSIKNNKGTFTKKLIITN